MSVIGAVHSYDFFSASLLSLLLSHLVRRSPKAARTALLSALRAKDFRSAPGR